MAAIYTMHLPIRRYEVDQHSLVHDHVYQQYMEEAAIEASTAAGYGAAWYNAQGTVWVIRDMTIEYLHPASLDDALQIRTWVADFRRVRSRREYEVYRASDRRLLARADCDWVYITRRTLWPARISEAMMAALPATGAYAVPPARPVPALPPGAQREHRCRRRVQRHEIDGMGHVNNANYVTWFEQATLDALAAWLPGGALGGRPCWRRHHIEYRSAVMPGEEVEIVTRVVGLGQARSAWRQEIRHSGSADVAVTDDSIVLLLDEQRRPQRWPRRIAGYAADAGRQ
jgi:acyl-CoA thioester hydrolase